MAINLSSDLMIAPHEKLGIAKVMNNELKV